MMESRHLRILTGIGVSAVTAAAVVAVVTDPKPASAPLHPPVSLAAPESITLPNNCVAPKPSAAVAADYATWRAAGTKAARTQFLSTLPSSERLQLQAYMTALQRSKGCSTSASAAPIGAATSSVTGAGLTTTSYVS